MVDGWMDGGGWWVDGSEMMGVVLVVSVPESSMHPNVCMQVQCSSQCALPIPHKVLLPKHASNLCMLNVCAPPPPSHTHAYSTQTMRMASQASACRQCVSVCSVQSHGVGGGVVCPQVSWGWGVGAVCSQCSTPRCAHACNSSSDYYLQLIRRSFRSPPPTFACRPCSCCSLRELRLRVQKRKDVALERIAD